MKQAPTPHRGPQAVPVVPNELVSSPREPFGEKEKTDRRLPKASTLSNATVAPEAQERNGVHRGKAGCKPRLHNLQGFSENTVEKTPGHHPTVIDK